MNTKTVKRRFITGFDGLRTWAVICVVLYHLNPNLFAGGYLGVPVFLTLSGYLITDHLMDEYQQTNTFNFKFFWEKRLKRLYPTLITMLFITAAYITLFQRNLLANLWQSILTNLTYVYNWWEIIHGQSYFQQFAGSESPFTHLWTLAIEGQFYLIWPIIAVLVLSFFHKNKKAIFFVSIGLAVFSALLMAFLFVPGADPSRVYYGTDTRMFSILLGAALAAVLPSKGLRKDVDHTHVVVLDVLGAIGALGMVSMIFTMDAQSTFTYRGGMFLFSLFTLFMIIAIVHPAGHWNNWLSGKFYHWVGSRSYAIYVYQLPVMVFFTDKFTDVADHFWIYAICEVALIIIISELSFRFIEKPMSHFDYHKIKVFFQELSPDNFKKLFIKAFKHEPFVKGLIIICGLVTVIGMFQSTQVSSANKSQLAQRIKKNNQAQKKNNQQVLSAIKNGKKIHKKIPKAYEKENLTRHELREAQGITGSAFGDSVMLDGRHDLHKIFPQMYIQATVALHAQAALPQIKKVRDEGALGQVVLIGLGTNGPVTPKTMKAIMKIVGPNRQVFWVNIHAPSVTWQNQVNSYLTKEQGHYQNLHIINWYQYSKAHPNVFYPDGTHPNVKGSVKYATFIAKNILTTLPQSKTASKK